MAQTVSLLVITVGIALSRIWVSSDTSSLSNFMPLMGIAFSAGFFFRSRLLALVPIGALIISDLVLNARYGVPLINIFSAASIVIYGLATLLGFSLSQKSSSLPRALGGGLSSTLVFYVVSNSLAWRAEAYTKDLAGWVQALTVGLPQYSPQTWVFLRNSMIADLSFIALVWISAWVSYRSSSRSTSQQTLKSSRASLSV